MTQAKLREDYLQAMQVDTWYPRVPLPYAKQSEILATISITPQHTKEKQVPPLIIPKENTPPESIQPLETIQATTTTPHFSLQLMQVGHCLLLIERPVAEVFQVKDPAYQLLRNILYAAKLPEAPLPLGDIIQWPLFKQSTIAQGKKEAKEFLQSFIITYKEQFTNTQCLWLIGSSSICHATDLNETNYFESPIIEPYGQTLLSPSLDMLMISPHLKAPLWHSIRKLIPLWQN